MASELLLEVDRDSAVPLGTQLAARIRAALADGTVAPGDLLPSVRRLADSAGVNVNTVRTVYARLESEGLVHSEQGRGTFAGGGARDDAATRRELRRQIARLEAALVRLPALPTLAEDARPRRTAPGAALLSTAGLEAVRDDLMARLGRLDEERAALLERLDQLGVEQPSAGTEPRRATPTLGGARITWVGA
jgi:GntR family transcriptional regulator